MVMIIIELREEGSQCLSDPYKFIAEKLETDNDAYVSCECNIFKGHGAKLKWDKDGAKLESNKNVNRDVETIKNPIIFNTTLPKLPEITTGE